MTRRIVLIVSLCWLAIATLLTGLQYGVATSRLQDDAMSGRPDVVFPRSFATEIGRTPIVRTIDHVWQHWMNWPRNMLLVAVGLMPDGSDQFLLWEARDRETFGRGSLVPRLALFTIGAAALWTVVSLLAIWVGGFGWRRRLSSS